LPSQTLGNIREGYDSGKHPKETAMDQLMCPFIAKVKNKVGEVGGL
jgi:hypothetical protein